MSTSHGLFEHSIEEDRYIAIGSAGDVLYVRPPYGSWDKSFEKELNMFPVLWTVDPLD